MNEWHMNFSGEKKNTQKKHTQTDFHRYWEKKNSNAPKNRSPISVFGFFWVWFRINPIFGVYAVFG